MKMGTSKLGIFHKLFAVVFCLISLISYRIEGRRIIISKEEDLELERQLKILNKPPIKTIHTEWGDIVDCIDIHKQPAFDHPLLKNHKIQMRPTSSPKRTIAEKNSSIVELESRSNIMSGGIECPEGTVPIRRTTKEDLIRAKSFLKTANSTDLDLIRVWAVLRLQNQGKKFFGASADLFTYNPNVGEDELSAAQFWIENGPLDEVNSIQAGWMVFPELYEDHLTRLFGFWTSDGYKTGCFGTLCSGFVQVDSRFYPGIPINHVSTFGGQQFYIEVYVYQAVDTGHWWLGIEGGINIGYWPKSLFNRLSEGADRLHWGGSVSAAGGRIYPPMGSEHYPDGDPTHACAMQHLEYVDEYDGSVPIGGMRIALEVNCKFYALNYKGYTQGSGNVIEFGGPGGQCT